SMARSLDDILNQGRTTARRFNDTLVRLDALLQDAQRVTKPLGDRSERILRNVDESLVTFNQVLGDVRALLRAVDRADGPLRRFLTDPSLYNDLDNVVNMVAKMGPRLEQILKDFEVFADKLARHPEKIGLGGVVRPSSGLKDPPTPPIAPPG